MSFLDAPLHTVPAVYEDNKGMVWPMHFEFDPLADEEAYLPKRAARFVLNERQYTEMSSKYTGVTRTENGTDMTIYPYVKPRSYMDHRFREIVRAQNFNASQFVEAFEKALREANDADTVEKSDCVSILADFEMWADLARTEHPEKGLAWVLGYDLPDEFKKTGGDFYVYVKILQNICNTIALDEDEEHIVDQAVLRAIMIAKDIEMPNMETFKFSITTTRRTSADKVASTAYKALSTALTALNNAKSTAIAAANALATANNTAGADVDAAATEAKKANDEQTMAENIVKQAQVEAANEIVAALEEAEKTRMTEAATAASARSAAIEAARSAAIEAARSAERETAAAKRDEDEPENEEVGFTEGELHTLITEKLGGMGTDVEGPLHIMAMRSTPKDNCFENEIPVRTWGHHNVPAMIDHSHTSANWQRHSKKIKACKLFITYVGDELPYSKNNNGATKGKPGSARGIIIIANSDVNLTSRICAFFDVSDVTNSENCSGNCMFVAATSKDALKATVKLYKDKSKNTLVKVFSNVNLEITGNSLDKNELYMYEPSTFNE